MSHIWNNCDLCEKFYAADTIRRPVKPIHKDWNICDLCENFYVADTIRRRVKSIHKNQKDFICSYCGKSFTQAVNLMKTIDEDQRYLKQQLMAMHWRHSEYVGLSSPSNGYKFRIIQGFSW